MEKTMTTKKIKKDKSKHYIDNQKFLDALVEYQEDVAEAETNGEMKPIVPNYIGDCFIKIANHLAYKSNFINYSFRDEMILDGIENCLTYMHNFDINKSKNPFAYFTQITYYVFVRRIQKEKRQLQTKYKYIESMDVDNLIRQIHDEGSYDNGFLKYLKQQADLAQQELSDAEKEKETRKIKRKPKYLQKLEEDEDEHYINEEEHIDKEVEVEY